MVRRHNGSTGFRGGNRGAGARRAGLAMTELAVCLPVLGLIILATVESSSMIFVQQSLSVAAYEGARAALAPGSKTSQVEQQCRQILTDREINDARVAVTPANLSDADEGVWIRVEASAPFSSNSLLGGWLFSSRVLTASTEMIKE